MIPFLRGNTRRIAPNNDRQQTVTMTCDMKSPMDTLQNEITYDITLMSSVGVRFKMDNREVNKLAKPFCLKSRTPIEAKRFCHLVNHAV
jgi:hypothetical protein